MIIEAIPPAYVDDYWGALAWAFEEFERATRGEPSAEDLRGQVRDAERQCWIAVTPEGDVKGVTLTQKVGGRIWLDFCTGKDSGEWASDMFDLIDKWARGEGGGMVAYCRPGWVKMLKRKGMRETHRIMEIDYG